MRPFLKILYENRGENTKEHDGETLKTSNVSNKIICRPPQYREIIPLMYSTIPMKEASPGKIMRSLAKEDKSTAPVHNKILSQ